MSPRMMLNMAAMQEEFFADSSLIGMVSAIPAYRFCWMLNNRFDLNFVRDAESDICLRDTQQHEKYFPVYKYCAPLNGNKYLIYKLKNDKYSLLPEVGQLDYLWMIQRNDSESEARNLLQYLRKLPDIQLAQIIMPEKLKNLSNLIL